MAMPMTLSQEAAYAGNNNSSQSNSPHSARNRQSGLHAGNSHPEHIRIFSILHAVNEQRPFSFNRLLAHAETVGINKALAFDAYFDAVDATRSVDVPVAVFEHVAKDLARRVHEAGDDLDEIAQVQGVGGHETVVHFPGGHVHVRSAPTFTRVETLAQLEAVVTRFRQGADDDSRLLVRGTDRNTGEHTWFNVVKISDVSGVPEAQRSQPNVGAPMVLFGDSRRPAFGPPGAGYLRRVGEDGISGQLSEADRHNLHDFQVLITKVV